MRHGLMNRGHTYRSKMACTPARAFRLLSSLEGGGFSAGPGAGIAGGRNGRRLADHESCSLCEKQNPLKSNLLFPGRRPLLLSLYSRRRRRRRRRHERLIRDGRTHWVCNPQAEMPRSPGRGFGPGSSADHGTGQGRAAQSGCHAGDHLNPPPEPKPVPPSRRRHYNPHHPPRPQQGTANPTFWASKIPWSAD